MMQALRDKMKYVMMIVAVGFLVTIVMSWGAGGFKNSGLTEQGLIGKINGQKIQYQQFAQLVSQQLDAYREQAPDQELPEYQIRAIRDQVWNNAVMEILQSEAVEKLGLQATPEEIVFRLRNDPPPYLRNIEQFQTDGQFDMAKYQQALNDPQNYKNWIPIENYLRQVIPMEKLRHRIVSSVHVSDTEVKEAYRQENEKVKAHILYFDPNAQSLENIMVTEADISQYYSAHKDDYLEPEQRQIEYIQFTVQPSAEDSAQTISDAKYILERLDDGADFGELAKEFSKDPGSGENGGDLGFFTKESMEAPFAEAAFNTRPGNVVGPVETRYGLHIIKVLAKKKEDGEDKVHAQHILLKYELSTQTRDAIENKAQYIYDEMEKDEKADLAALAINESQELKESPFFRKGGFIPGIGMADRLVNLTFQNKIGVLSRPTYAGENVVLFRVKDIKKSHIQPLEEVTQTIQRTLQFEKKKEKAASLCNAAYAKIQSGATLDAVAAQDSIEIITTDYFNIQASIPRIGREAKINGAAFRLQAGTVSEPIHATRGSYLIQVLDHQSINENIFQSELQSRRDQLLRQKQSAVWMAWLNDLKENATIQDYREYYY